MNIRKRRKRVTLYLHNDEFNSFESVTLLLSRYIPKCTLLRAEQLAIITHHTGCSEIYSGFSPNVYSIQANLIRSGLLVETKKRY